MKRCTTREERERRRMRKVYRRKRFWNWWSHYGVYVFLLGVFLTGFLVGWLVHTPKEPAAVPEETVTPPVIQQEAAAPIIVQEEQPMEVFYYDVPLSEDLQDHIRELCDEHDIPMALVLAIIGKESCYEPDAISSTGDYGLMQINKGNFDWLSEDYGVTDFLNPYQNTYAGIMVLNGLLDIFDTEEEAVMAYNRGPTGARNLLAEGITSTDYSTDVMVLYSQLKEAAPEAGTSKTAGE